MNNFEKKIEGMIEDLAVSVSRGFDDQNEKFKAIDKRLGRLENDNVIFKTKFDKLEDDNVWIKDVLESHTTILARLDQERIFTINHISRLELEIEAIKKQLKIV